MGTLRHRPNGYASIDCISASTLEFSFDARKKVVISIDASRSSELASLQVRPWIAYSRTAGSFLMAFGTREGACSGIAAWATIFGYLVAGF